MTATVHLAKPGAEPEWEADLLDLDAYLSFIGYTGPRAATLEALTALHAAHQKAICWEIVEMAVGRHISLDMATLQRKLVRDRNGGCCLEINLLFAAALERFGFPVSRQLARVRRGNMTTRTRSHVVLLVEVDGELWMSDPGFGDETPLAPIRFQDGAEVTVGGWTWRLDADGDDWVMRCRHADGWFDVYAWTIERQYMVDMDMVNHFSYADPKSVFIGKLVAQRGSPEERWVLKDQVLVTSYPDGRTETAYLSGDEVVTALREVFGTDISDEDAKTLSERYGPAPVPAG